MGRVESGVTKQSQAKYFLSNLNLRNRTVIRGIVRRPVPVSHDRVRAERAETDAAINSVKLPTDNPSISTAAVANSSVAAGRTGRTPAHAQPERPDSAPPSWRRTLGRGVKKINWPKLPKKARPPKSHKKSAPEGVVEKEPELQPSSKSTRAQSADASVESCVQNGFGPAAQFQLQSKRQGPSIVDQLAVHLIAAQLQSLETIEPSQSALVNIRKRDKIEPLPLALTSIQKFGDYERVYIRYEINEEFLNRQGVEIATQYDMRDVYRENRLWFEEPFAPLALIQTHLNSGS